MNEKILARLGFFFKNNDSFLLQNDSKVTSYEAAIIYGPVVICIWNLPVLELKWAQEIRFQCYSCFEKKTQLLENNEGYECKIH